MRTTAPHVYTRQLYTIPVSISDDLHFYSIHTSALCQHFPHAKHPTSENPVGITKARPNDGGRGAFRRASTHATHPAHSACVPNKKQVIWGPASPASSKHVVAPPSLRHSELPPLLAVLAVIRSPQDVRDSALPCLVNGEISSVNSECEQR
jgi:hypothetical protein